MTRALLLAALLSGACLPLGCAARRGGTAAERSEPIDFTAPLLSGGTYQLSKDRGHPVVIDVWATWCEPCKDTLPIIDALRREYVPKGVQVYGLNVHSEPKELGKFLTALDVHLPVLLDPNADVADGILAVHRMPTSFVIDGKGVVRSRHEGVPADLLKSTRAQLEELLDAP